MLDLHPDTDVLLLSANGEKLGTMKARQAKILAAEQELDLVVISRQESAVVCKIMDEAKWRYQQKKKQKSQHKRAPQLKEVRFGVSTAEHDINVKLKHVRAFIDKGCSVKISIEMRGRERSHAAMAKSRLESIILSLSDLVRPGEIRTTSNCVFMTVQPTRARHGESNEEQGDGDSQRLIAG